MTPLRHRVVSFIQGFRDLHRVGPAYEDIERWIAPESPSERVELWDAVRRLTLDKRITRDNGRRFRVLIPQRCKVFSVVRVYNFDPDVLDHEQKLEPYRAHSKPMERRG